MRLSELLAPEHVLLPLEAADKWQAIAALVQLGVRSGKLDKRRAADVEAALRAREKSMTTGMEHGIAIPHAAVDGIPDIIAMLGLSTKGVPFEALDGKPAQIMVCLVIPWSKKVFHIKTLAEIAKLLGKANVRERLLQCQNSEQVLATIVAAGG